MEQKDATEQSQLLSSANAEKKNIDPANATVNVADYIGHMHGPPVRVRCGDGCPVCVRFVRNFFLGFIGFLSFLLLIAPTLLLFILVSYLCCCCFGNGHFNDRTPNATALRCCCCGKAPRYFFSAWRLKLTLVPLPKRGCVWAIANFLVGFYQILEFLSHSRQGVDNSIYLCNDLSNKYGDYFPLLFGLGCADAERVAHIIRNDADSNLIKGQNIFSIVKPDIYRYGYGINEPISLSKRASRNRSNGVLTHAIARRCHHALQAYFRSRMANNPRALTEELQRIVPESSAIADSELVSSCAKAIYHCLLGYTLTDSELQTLVRFNKLGIAATLMPSVMHFFWCGYYLEHNVIEEALLTVKNILIKVATEQPSHPVFVALVKVCEDEDIELWQAINCLLAQMVTGALPGITHCVQRCIRTLRGSSAEATESAQTYLEMFENNPYHFVLESFRLNGAPFGITITLPKDEQLEINGRMRTVPEGTLLVLMHGCRMREPHIFGEDSNRFNPNRGTLMECTPFNAMEDGFRGYCTGQQVPTAEYRDANPKSFHRYCTGHDVAFFICKFVTDQHKPRVRASSNLI